ncbi:hypothetical protein [Kocuria sp. SM24M-10]|uniref:hypothetical protein n=1 Tax=Kocuria sp. SM24M-10 TaxID=1660349 RepID=UPI000AF66393|nr:hypothetical protein [Kocuria sp. SM24M-10]
MAASGTYGCRILGHGVEAGSTIYCCTHCAKHAGVEGFADRAQRPGPGGHGR